MKRLLVGLVLAVFAPLAIAMQCVMTTEQKNAVKTAVLAEPSLAVAVSTGNDNAVAAWLNAPASPQFVVWKTRVTQADMHASYVWTEMDNLTQAKFNQLTLMLQPGFINPSVANIRQGIQDVFSGAQLANTRTALTALAKRDASNVEKLLASGTGSTATPATMGCEGPATSSDVASILRG